MEDKIFNIGYSKYLSKGEKKKRKWTSKIIEIINNHKILTMSIVTIIVCMIMNVVLILNFIKIIEIM